jgi:hypothetical protein
MIHLFFTTEKKGPRNELKNSRSIGKERARGSPNVECHAIVFLQGIQVDHG